MSDPRQNRNHHAGLLASLCAVVAIVVLVAHWPALSARAISFDDNMYLVNNSAVQNPSWASARRFLTEVRAPSTVMGYYQPLTMISLMLDCAMGGSPDNLAPFHRTSLALHVANTVLVCLLLYRLIGNPWAAALVALLFGVHPMAVEPIPWIGERKTLLATFFALWSLLAYVAYARSGRRCGTAALGSVPGVQAPQPGAAGLQRCAYGLALGAFVLALLAKPTVTPLPLLLVLLDFWPLGRLTWRTVVEKTPFFVIAGVSAVITYISQSATAKTYNTGAGSWLRIPYILCHNIIFYPRKMLWPVNLSSHYPIPLPLELSNPTILAGVIGTVLLMVALLVSLRWTRALLAGWLFFFLAILPTMGVIGFTIVIASDKYAYFPVFGLLLILAAAVNVAWHRTAAGTPLRVGLVAVVVLVVGFEVRATRNYLKQWRDTETLALHMLKIAPDAAILHNHLGTALLARKDYAGAEQAFKRSLQLDPASATCLDNLGITFFDQQRYQEAITCFQDALAHDKRNPNVRYNLANAYLYTNRLDEAERYFRETIALNAPYQLAYNNLGGLLRMRGNHAEAEAMFRKALELNPRYTDARSNLADSLADRGQMDEALREYRVAIGYDQTSVNARKHLAELLSHLGRWPEAITEYRGIVRLHPQSAAAHIDLAAALFHAKPPQIDDAIGEFEHAIWLNPDDASTRFNLGTVLVAKGRMQEAANAFREALRIKPTHAGAHNRLGYALEQLGRVDEAIEHYRKAVELDPEDAGACWNLAETLLARGDRDGARDAYRRVLELQPDRADARSRLDSLTTRPAATTQTAPSK